MTVSRRGLLATGAMALAAPKVWAAPRLTYDLVPKRVADGVWMIEGTTEYFTFENGGNIVNVAFIETDTGAVIVDSGPSRRYAEELRKVVTETVPLGVAAVINTHHHPDHFFGNQVFADIPIHGLPETKALAGEHGDAYADAMYRLVGDWMRGTEPMPPSDVLASSDLTIGGRSLGVLAMGGHTEADLVILDHQTGTAIAGDLAFLDRAPTTPDADLPRWHASLDQLESLETSGIVPGHGPFDAEKRSITQTRAYLDWLDKAITGAIEDGLDMVETMQLDIPPDFAAMGAQPRELERSVSHLFNTYERAALPKVN